MKIDHSGIGGPVAGRDIITNYYITVYKDSEREFVISNKSNITPCVYFTGRETELSDLRHRIEAEGKHILITGMGGIGKTHICRMLFKEYKRIFDNKEDIFFDHIGYLEYENNLEYSILQCVRYKKQENPVMNVSAAWEELYHVASNGRLLLFLDNVNSTMAEDPDLKRLFSIPAVIVLTSRRASFGNGFEAYPIGFLSLKECEQIYKKIRYRNTKAAMESEEESDLVYIIEKLVAKHTMTVELLAHLAWAKNYNVQELKKNLQDNGFKLVFHKDGELINIQKSYEILYDLSELSQPEKNILEAFSMFPYLPLELEICRQWLLEDSASRLGDDVFIELSNKGWLQFEREKKTFSMHPVFSEVIFNMCKPTAENHAGLINGCKKSLDVKKNDFSMKNQKFIPFAEMIVKKCGINDPIEKVGFLCKTGQSLYYLYHYERAKVFYEDALKIYHEKAECFNKDCRSIIFLYCGLAFAYKGLGLYKRAETFALEALKIGKAKLGGDDPCTLEAGRNLASIYTAQGDYRKAEGLLKEVIHISETILEEKDISESYFDLADLYAQTGNYEEAQKLFDRVLPIKENLLGKEHPDVASIYDKLANLYINLGDYKKAENLSKKTVDIREHVFGEEHPETASAYCTLANIYEITGRYKEESRLFRKALRIRESIFGESHIITAESYGDMAIVYKNEENYKKAEEMTAKALKIYQSVWGDENPNTAKGYNNMAIAYDIKEDYGQARRLYHEVLEIYNKTYGNDHIQVLNTYLNLAGTYLDCEEYEQAEELYQKVLDGCRKIVGEDSRMAAYAYHMLGEIYVFQENYEKAEKYLQKSLSIFQDKLGIYSSDTAQVYIDMGNLSKGRYDYEKAKDRYQEALKIAEEMPEKDSKLLTRYYDGMSRICQEQGDYNQYRKLMKKELVFLKQWVGEDHTKVADYYMRFSEFYANDSGYSKAMDMLYKAYQIYLLKLGKSNYYTISAYDNMKNIYNFLSSDGNFSQWLENKMMGGQPKESHQGKGILTSIDKIKDWLRLKK